ncbi:hypothetical protein FACS189426_08530 [Bacteroidia bacterium]|nr:hypothetical protein FACS189426_08530 [Bacteroidia bacterium]
MKHLIFLLAFLNLSLVSFAQTGSSLICRFGFTFEISRQKNWGYAKPVILTVSPNTSAAAQGLQVNDIVDAVNGKPTEGEDYETIFSWLQNSANDQISLNISNLKNSNRSLILTKYCSFNNALTEKDLAEVYAFYSLEDTQNRAFACPFKTTVNRNVNLLNYKSFGFPKPNAQNLQLENLMNAVIRKSLEQKGLKYSDRNPDVLVQTYYSHRKNPNYRSNANADKFPTESRYNMNTHSMENLPIYYNLLIHSNQAEFFLTLGIRVVDPKRQDNNGLVWECEANELLKSYYSLDDYSTFHIPLMFMQYPYPQSTEEAKFFYGRSRYNYTGIYFNMDNLKEIISVDPSSPAAQAGIQSGDVIEKINGVKFNNNPKSADSNYKQFIYKTMSFRNPKTQFTNAEGFTRCMYWDKLSHAQIYDAFRRPEFSTAFSYLFYFEPYINLSGTNIVSFNIVRGKQKEEIKVKPVIVEEAVFESR